MRGETLPRWRALSQGELRVLFGVCVADPSPAGARDATLLAVLYGAGLRRSEVVTLDLEDYNPERREIRIHGNGNKERLAYLPEGAGAALTAWLKRRVEFGPGSLFVPITRKDQGTDQIGVGIHAMELPREVDAMS